MHRVERMAQRVIAHPDLRAALDDVWAHLRTVLIDAADDPASELRQRGVQALVEAGERLRDDPGVRARFDARAQDISAFAVRSYGNELTAVITETVERWDGEDAARRIELHVGRDLQFIRINGTVVGGLAGLVIHTITVLVT